MDSATVTVRGHAVVPGTPDQARLALELKSLESTPQAALAHVAERSEELERILDELEIAQKSRSTSGISVHEEREYEGRRYVHRGYTASNQISIKLDDEALVGKLMREATNRSQARVSGPWWQVALDNPARAEACRQAAADARRKAEAYVNALGARLGAVASVAEPGLGRFEPNYDRSDMMASSDRMADSDQPVEVHAGDLDISAMVEVVFWIEQDS